MSDQARRSPLAFLRHVATSLERAAVAEAASGAVRGVADELREQLPDGDGELKALVEDFFTSARRLVHQTATPGALEAAAHDVAVASTRGALDELERQWREGGLPLHGLITRLNVMLDRITAYADERAHDLANPDERARRIAINAVDGATDQLRSALPELANDLRVFTPSAVDLATKTSEAVLKALAEAAQKHPAALAPLLESSGRSFARGVVAGLSEEVEARVRSTARRLRRPLSTFAAATGVLFAGLFAASALRSR